MPINQDSFRKEVHANWDLEAPEYSVEIKMPMPGRRRYERGNGDVWTRRSGKRSYGGYDRSSGRRFKQTNYSVFSLTYNAITITIPLSKQLAQEMELSRLLCSELLSACCTRQSNHDGAQC